MTFFTFDYPFDSYRAWKLKDMAVALGLNGLAYVLPAFYWRTVSELLIPLSIVGVLFTLHFAFSRAKGWKSPITYAVAGSSYPLRSRCCR